MANHMTILILFAVGIASSTQFDIKAATDAEFNAFRVTAAEECRVENHVAKGEWEKLAANRHMPHDKNLSCMAACFMEKFKSLNTDGTLNWEQIELWNKKEHGELGVQYLKICRPKVDETAERCELARALVDCYFVEGEKLGLFNKP
ncbi:uncharacterized protein LOC106669092 [Cimex lectularius]|uniref:Odorant binding protein n=1 Tax=Cimex lectularius TaxID=79782 RepID=A0A8I6RY75_CIMLE|nr:uncharacterized protein LOC106669092 [Cimex lectularius]